MAKVKLTQIKSKSGATKRQIANLTSLGIHRMHQSVIVELTPVTEGMIERVSHLVTVEPVNE
ncbi:MAG: 50S ribosomal protein L30 [Bacteroidales bacterium]|nr:50S ribosomal protein L30 [Bacteroidales bacterium]